MSLSQDIKSKAIELGFDLVGITDASPIDAEQAELLAKWLKSGFAGCMDYMHRNLQKRTHPAELLENAQSVIVVGLNFNSPPRKKTPDTTVPTGKIVDYAQYQDYHPFIENRLRELTDFINSKAGGKLQFKICVDSAPIAERALAMRAGLGFIGRNHMLINPKLGCEIFLGEVITNLKLETDEPFFYHSERSEAESLRHSERSHHWTESRNLSEKILCSNCHKCIDACPIGALRADGQLDASRCINYLTIEHKGQIPAELAEKIDDRLFGCDECILICPYQKNAPACKNKQLKFYNDRAELNLHEVLSLSDELFESKFADSPIKRLGLEGLKRNAQICLANISFSHREHREINNV